MKVEMMVCAREVKKTKQEELDIGPEDRFRLNGRVPFTATVNSISEPHLYPQTLSFRRLIVIVSNIISGCLLNPSVQTIRFVNGIRKKPSWRLFCVRYPPGVIG